MGVNFCNNVREIKYYFNIWGITKRKKGAQKKGGWKFTHFTSPGSAPAHFLSSWGELWIALCKIANKSDRVFSTRTPNSGGRSGEIDKPSLLTYLAKKGKLDLGLSDTIRWTEPHELLYLPGTSNSCDRVALTMALNLRSGVYFFSANGEGGYSIAGKITLISISLVF